MPIADPWAGRGGRAGLRAVLLDVGTGNTPFRFGNVGGDPPYGKDPWGVLPPCGETDHSATTLVSIRKDLVLPTADGRNEGGDAGGTGNLHLQEAEHGGPVYHNLDHSGPLSGGVEAPGGVRWRNGGGSRRG